MIFSAGKGFLLEAIWTRLRNVARPFIYFTQLIGELIYLQQFLEMIPKGAQHCAPFVLPKSSARHKKHPALAPSDN